MKFLTKKDEQIIKDKITDYKVQFNKLTTQLNELQTSFKNQTEFLMYILSFKDNSLENIVTNKTGEKLYLIKNEDDKNLEFYLYKTTTQELCSKILTTKTQKYKLNNNEFIKQYNYIYIDDFNSSEENVGNGSILMSYLLNYLQSKKYRYIIGYLSPVDFYNRTKQEYFYKKFNFKVQYKNNDKQEGQILLELDELKNQFKT